jgi:hypothetical protein
MDSKRLVLNIAIPEKVSTSFLKAKDFLTSTTDRAVNTVTDATNANSVSHMKEAAKSSFNEVAERVAFETDKAIDNVAITASQTKDALTETIRTTTGKTVTTLSETASQAGDYIKGSVEHTWQKADGLSSAVSAQVDKAIASSITSKLDAVNLWIDSHPTISWITKTILWGINHPIFSIIILLLAMFILWQLVKTSAKLAEQGLLSILKFPFNLVRFVFGASVKPFGKLTVSKTPLNQPEANAIAVNNFISGDMGEESQERLTNIITRLDAIAQEQNDLLEEVRTILKSTKISN